MSKGPLAGLKVVEIAGIGPAPCAGMMLADLGADVVLVERRSSQSANGESPSDGYQFAIYNRGKRSLALDLKQPAAIDIVLSLVAEADVLIEGFRPGVMERLGLGPEVCLARNPRLVYGRMTGWGQTGPLAKSAGHDPNYIALSGALWAGSGPDRPPTAPLTLVGDVGGGTMVLLLGVLSAVFHAKSTGEGQVVDAAITDGSAYISTLLRMMHNTGQLSDEAGSGWSDYGSPWNDNYPCADGHYISICALEPQFYALLMEKLGLQDHPLFANQWDKSQWPEGKRVIAEVFKSKTREQWCQLLEGTDACFAPVLNMSEALEHPHNKARGTFTTVDGVIQPSPAPSFSRTVTTPGNVPYSGQHTESLLTSLGYDAVGIAGLSEQGVI